MPDRFQAEQVLASAPAVAALEALAASGCGPPSQPGRATPRARSRRTPGWRWGSTPIAGRCRPRRSRPWCGPERPMWPTRWSSPGSRSTPRAPAWCCCHATTAWRPTARTSGGSRLRLAGDGLLGRPGRGALVDLGPGCRRARMGVRLPAGGGHRHRHERPAPRAPPAGGSTPARPAGPAPASWSASARPTADGLRPAPTTRSRPIPALRAPTLVRRGRRTPHQRGRATRLTSSLGPSSSMEAWPPCWHPRRGWPWCLGIDVDLADGMGPQGRAGWATRRSSCRVGRRRPGPRSRPPDRPAQGDGPGRARCRSSTAQGVRPRGHLALWSSDP